MISVPGVPGGDDVKVFVVGGFGILTGMTSFGFHSSFSDGCLVPESLSSPTGCVGVVHGKGDVARARGMSNCCADCISGSDVLPEL